MSILLDGFLQKECLASGSSEPRNRVQIFAFTASSHFSAIVSSFVDIHTFSQILVLLCHSKWWWKEEQSRKLGNTCSVKRKL